MPALSLASDLGLSVPLTTTQRPFILWVGGTDLAGYAEIKSYALDDKDLTQPGIFTVTFTDANNVAGQYIHRLDEVMWVQTNPERILFRGFVRQIDMTPQATYGLWTITCTDLSEMLDYAMPVVSDSRPAETTKARVQYFLGNYGTASSMGTGGHIGTLSGAAQPATAFQRETLRTAIEKSLVLEATSAQAASYYLDYLYQFHAFYGMGDTAAPYALTDGAYDRTTTCPYGNLTATQDSTADTDGVYVYGVSAAGSYLWQSGVPRWPKRYSSRDSSTSTTAATAIGAAAAELSMAQNINRVQLVVTGYDGWAKGQSVSLTNSQMGWAATAFWIAGVSMRTLSPAGYREYTLQLNASLPRMSRIMAAAQNNQGPTLGAAIQGQIGGY